MKKKSRGRPRDPVKDSIIISEILNQLLSRGYTALTISDVATESGVSKATIYRRWNSKSSLVVDALKSLPGLQVPSTGRLKSDIKHLVTQVIAVNSKTNLFAVLQILTGEMFNNKKLEKVMHPYLNDRMTPVKSIIQEAIERGVISKETNIEASIYAVIGPLIAMSFFKQNTINESLIRPLTELIYRGLQK